MPVRGGKKWPEGNDNNGNGAFGGFGAEWRPSDLSRDEARRATDWVEAKIDKRALLTGKERKEDIRDAMWQLEKGWRNLVHRVSDVHDPVMAKALYGYGTRKSPPVICGITSHVASAAIFPVSKLCPVADEQDRRHLS
ncbi:MAG: hypothetical protein R3D34_18680 [Nitratireductor sp.]